MPNNPLTLTDLVAKHCSITVEKRCPTNGHGLFFLRSQYGLHSTSQRLICRGKVTASLSRTPWRSIGQLQLSLIAARRTPALMPRMMRAHTTTMISEQRSGEDDGEGDHGMSSVPSAPGCPAVPTAAVPAVSVVNDQAPDE